MIDMSKCIDRFLEPQKTSYAIALEEVHSGRKVSHWMWYIFPQLRGLGQSDLVWYYGIQNLGGQGRIWPIRCWASGCGRSPGQP